MECRKLEITLVSAQNLPNLRNLGLMKVYAKVSLEGEANTSLVDNEGGTNPRWNFVVNYMVSESTVRRHGVNVVVQLWCKRTLGDRFIGDVMIPVKELFDMGLRSESVVSYDVAGTPEGTLDLMYSFSERMVVRKPPSWWTTALGCLVLVGGVMLLLGTQSDHHYVNVHDQHDEPQPADQD
ncbi:protein SRC2-like [Salvia miltiorrhiza]|uniref:protein SRC2-like n=1 Tax=Salvia miltiorrhiza TaxID=226208 RepID=UPI0025AC2BE6|nr:protein SRC2-like [Salvia miltiorrhiza]